MSLPATFVIAEPWMPVHADSGLALAGYAFPPGTAFDCVAMSEEGVMDIEYYEPSHAGGTLRVHQGEYPVPAATTVDGDTPHVPSILAKWGVPLAGGHVDHIGMWDVMRTINRSVGRAGLEGSFYLEYDAGSHRKKEYQQRQVYWRIWEWPDGVVEVVTEYYACTKDGLGYRRETTENRGFIRGVTLEEAVVLITGGTPRCSCGETRTEKNHDGWNACVGCGTV